MHAPQQMCIWSRYKNRRVPERATPKGRRLPVGIMQDIYRTIAGCEAAGHIPDRRRVRAIDGDFQTKCRHCHVALIRYGSDDWRERQREDG